MMKRNPHLFIFLFSLLNTSLSYTSPVNTDDKERDRLLAQTVAVVRQYNPHNNIQVYLPTNDEFQKRTSDHVASISKINFGGEMIQFVLWNLWCPGTQSGFDKFQNAPIIRNDLTRIQIQKDRLANFLKQSNTIIMTQEMQGSAFVDFLKHMRLNSSPTIQGEYQECQRGAGSSFGVATFYDSSMFKQERIFSNPLERSMMHKFTNVLGNTFYAWNAHLKWIGNDLSKAPTIHGMLKNAFNAPQISGPKFILGDFNYNLGYLAATMPTHTIYTIENGSLVSNTNTAHGFHFNTTDGLIAEFSLDKVEESLETLLTHIDPALHQTVRGDHLAGQFSLDAIKKLGAVPQAYQAKQYIHIFEGDMFHNVPADINLNPPTYHTPYTASVNHNIPAAIVPPFNWGRHGSFETCLSKGITGSLQSEISRAYAHKLITSEDVVAISQQTFRNQPAFWTSLKAQRSIQ